MEADHRIVLILTFGAALALGIAAKRIRRIRDDRPLRMALALALAANEIASWFFFRHRGLMLLPLHLCDWALFAMVFALLTGSRPVTELAFFWGLAASTQAILTPDLDESFPSFPWISFFASHSAVVLAAIYLAARGWVKVAAGSVWRVWLLTNVYVLGAGLANWRLGTNFGYLAAKPAHPSLLDSLGPWPYYILLEELIALVLFFLCFGLSRLIEERAKGGQSEMMGPR